MPRSRAALDASMPWTIDSYSSSEERNGGGPAAGQRLQSRYRELAYPVSVPRWKGELADRASSVGSHGRRWLLTAMASDRLETPMCTWVPQVASSTTK